MLVYFRKFKEFLKRYFFKEILWLSGFLVVKVKVKVKIIYLFFYIFVLYILGLDIIYGWG